MGFPITLVRNHASWGSQNDFFDMFFTQDAFDKFEKSKEELQDTLDKEKKKAEADKKGKR